MSEQAEKEWGRNSAELAYSIIARYVEHAQICGMLIARLASALGEEQLKPVVQTEVWQLYMSSKRILEEARRDIEALTRLIEQMQAKP